MNPEMPDQALDRKLFPDKAAWLNQNDLCDSLDTESLRQALEKSAFPAGVLANPSHTGISEISGAESQKSGTAEPDQKTRRRTRKPK